VKNVYFGLVFKNHHRLRLFIRRKAFPSDLFDIRVRANVPSQRSPKRPPSHLAIIDLWIWFLRNTLYKIYDKPNYYMTIARPVWKPSHWLSSIMRVSLGLSPESLFPRQHGHSFCKDPHRNSTGHTQATLDRLPRSHLLTSSCSARKLWISLIRGSASPHRLSLQMRL